MAPFLHLALGSCLVLYSLVQAVSPSLLLDPFITLALAALNWAYSKRLFWGLRDSFGVCAGAFRSSFGTF